MNDSRLTYLIQAHLDELITPDEQRELDRRLCNSESARQQFWEESAIHGAMHEAIKTSADLVAAETSLKAAAGDKFVTPLKTEGRFRWSRITSTAAGILIGIFSASMVWAYAVPLVSQTQRESREIVFESFEDPEMKSPRRFPTSASRWFGGMRSVLGTGGMPAVEGTRVGKFANVPQHRFSDARYIVDLDEYGELSDKHTRSIEVSGSFFSPGLDHTSVFRIDVAAFGEAPEAVPPVWFDREHLNDVVLQRVARNFNPEPGDQPTWHEVKVTMEIPPGARSLVVSLSAGKRAAGGGGSDRYLDAVRVHLVDTSEPVD